MLGVEVAGFQFEIGWWGKPTEKSKDLKKRVNHGDVRKKTLQSV